MTTIVTRTGKGSPLTHVEVDTNFTNLNTAKLENLVAAAGAGTAAAPSISFTNDNNTGVFSPGADQLAISTNGTGRLYVIANGNIGLGENTPSQLLTIRKDGAGAATDVVFLNNSSVAAGTAVGISFGPNTTNDITRSAIIRGINESSGSGTATGLGFFTNANASSPTEKMRLDSSGRLGLGTSGPTQKLHIVETSAGATTTPLLVQNRGDAASTATQIALIATGSDIGDGQFAAIKAYSSEGVSQTSHDLALLTCTAGGTPTERLYITRTGRVGIGTTSPGAILHTVNTSAGAATVGAFIQNSSLTAGTEVRLGFAPNTNVIGDNRYSWIGAVNGTGSTDSSLTFATTPGGTGATERMRIKSDGIINFSNAPTYADNTAATAGGLAVGDVYKTVLGVLMIRF